MIVEINGEDLQNEVELIKSGDKLGAKMLLKSNDAIIFWLPNSSVDRSKIASSFEYIADIFKFAE